MLSSMRNFFVNEWKVLVFSKFEFEPRGSLIRQLLQKKNMILLCNVTFNVLSGQISSVGLKKYQDPKDQGFVRD